MSVLFCCITASNWPNFGGHGHYCGWGIVCNVCVMVCGVGFRVWYVRMVCVREVAVVCNVWAFVLLRNVFLVNLSKITNIIAKCSITKIVKNKS